jgi:hypothetical protein
MKIRLIFNFSFLIFLFFTPPSIKAQNKKKKKENPKAAWTNSRTALEPLPIHASGLRTVDFFGAKIGVDYPFKMTELRGFKSTVRGHRMMREQYISADLGLWHYKGVHENAFFSTEWTVRFINGKGTFFQVSPLGVGVNYILTPFLSARYNRGEVPEIGKVYVTPSVSIGLGKDFAFRRAHRGLPLTLFAKAGVSAMYPFKKMGYIFPTGEVGYALRFRGINAFVRKVRRD